MYPDRRIQAARRAAQSRRLLATQQAHALYGIDPDDVMPLGGWFTSLKRKAGNVVSSAARSTVPVLRKIGSIQGAALRATRDADIPLLSSGAKAGLAAQESYESVVRQVNKATESPTESDATTAVASRNKWIIPGLVLAAGAFVWFGRK